MALPIVYLMGPTASGKSDFSLTLAERFNGEIVCVDSATIYRYMDIGTAKPDLTTQQQYPHHLLNIIDPTERYSAHQFVDDVTRCIKDIHGRGRVPFLVGGTMLYFKSLMFGLNELPQADVALRQQLDLEARRHGWSALHQRLQEVDPETAKRLSPQDSQRIQRALEVYLLTGQPLSFFHRPPLKPAWPGPVLPLGFLPERREDLHQRIEQRFRTMISLGLEEELRALKERFDLSANLPSMRCVGYRQMWQYLEREIDNDHLLQSGVYATRQLAKRQITWLRSWPDLRAMNPFENNVEIKLIEQVDRFLNQSLSGKT